MSLKTPLQSPPSPPPQRTWWMTSTKAFILIEPLVSEVAEPPPPKRTWWMTSTKASNMKLRLTNPACWLQGGDSTATTSRASTPTNTAVRWKARAFGS